MVKLSEKERTLNLRQHYLRARVKCWLIFRKENLAYVKNPDSTVKIVKYLLKRLTSTRSNDIISTSKARRSPHEVHHRFHQHRQARPRDRHPRREALGAADFPGSCSGGHVAEPRSWRQGLQAREPVSPSF